MGKLFRKRTKNTYYMDRVDVLVGIYDMLVPDWGVFCHSKKLRIPGTEDMDADYTNYLFHVKGAMKGTIIGIVVALLSGGMIWLIV